MNDQQLQQFLAFLQQNMANQQQTMADLPQRAQQAGATPTQGSGGTTLSPDPVRRVQQANEAWRERFPNPVEAAARLGMTPEALLASQGNTATNQWAQLGGVPGVDPQKLRDMNRQRNQYSDFARAQREGTNGRVTEITPAGSLMPAQPMAPAPQASAAPATGGVPAGNIFAGAAEAVKQVPGMVGSAAQQVPGMVGNAVNAAQDWWKQNVLPNAQPATSLAAPIEGSNLRQNVLQGLNFIPNAVTAGVAKLAEGVGSIFGEQVDLPSVNFQSDVFSNVRNILENNAPSQAERARIGANQQANQQLRSEGAYDSVSGPNQDQQRNALMQNRVERNTNPGLYFGVPNQAPPALQLDQPGAMIPSQATAFQGSVTPGSLLPQNMFATEEERKRRQQQQPMMASR